MTKAQGETFKVDTRPTKPAIVDSLTRDISVEACVFDLIDNAIDAAREAIYERSAEKNGGRDKIPESFKGFRIEIKLTGERFIIQDNCGGISLEKFRTDALRFGQRSSHTFGIGVFGVGMNRALFKLGESIHIDTDTGRDRAELTLDVNTYLKATGWNITATKLSSRKKPGTRIEVSRPSTEVASQLADPGHVKSLKHEIGLRYGRFIGKGLTIKVGGSLIEDGTVVIRPDSPYPPEHKTYRTADGVGINIVYGQHLLHRFGNEDGSDADGNRALTPEFGWTVTCNDRAVLIADRSPKTGWDTKFHSEFYGFVGRVEFTCPDPSILPWATTKTDIDLNNPAYQTALADMRRFVEAWRTKAGLNKALKRQKKQLVARSPAATAPLKKAGLSKNAAKSSTLAKSKIEAKVDHNTSPFILPEDVNELYCDGKHLALVHEAKTLNLAKFTYSGVMLMRVLFETTVITFLTRHGKFKDFIDYVVEKRTKDGDAPTKAAKDITPRLEESIGYLTKHPEHLGSKQPYLKHSLARMQHHKPILNETVHNPYTQIGAPKAFDIRDDIVPILRHLIET